MCVPGNEATPQQPAKLRINPVQTGVSGVRKFGGRENRFPMECSLFSEKGLPVQNFHKWQTCISNFREQSRTVLPPPPAFICCATVVSICWSITFWIAVA